ncbi:MAG: hypothetical protein CME85_06115 [Henriciella sp.]|jgi:hypothetical protein|uniref:hypothetical protein n=1 Tax=Henriciella sp. TaxID=1968823 RepID=UPI000C0CDDEA|nr:hypothetical protein [Henriciella sp.]MAN74376.1 hypothetical protein [Henriciella sp.]MBF34468.1 hypothetical protein [Hyphomonadaceae bacterium]MBK75060.1 hypothetical protein [Henriciella sp.]PHR79988.1 MAG: hypothetical protein COA64_04370 [Henriciella sp.]|tara:strand:+ start:1023 stop:1214 length:192 start_codon:yes stop_codon:yes gene_type:complete
MQKPKTFLGWAGVVFMLTVIAVIVMLAASIAFVVVAGVAILGAVIALVLLLAKRKAEKSREIE